MKNNFANFVLFSLGSNIGNKSDKIIEAIEVFEFADVLHNIKISSFYESEPFGEKEQDWFVNIAISGYTDHSPDFLLGMLKNIEYLLGRKIRNRWREREIDIDILLYDDLIYSTKYLTIPHPQMHLRRFVLFPACEIAPEVIHPIFQIPIKKMLENCTDNSIVRKI